MRSHGRAGYAFGALGLVLVIAAATTAPAGNSASAPPRASPAASNPGGSPAPSNPGGSPAPSNPGGSPAPSNPGGSPVARPDTVVTLGTARRDLTGDGRPETLRLVGTGRSLDSLDLTFSIESSGDVIFRTSLHPLTRRPGLGPGGQRDETRAGHRARVDAYGAWFFADSKFMTPAEFVEAWTDMAPARVPRIPELIARNTSHDAERAGAIWDEIQRAGTTVFEFSKGGDHVTVIAWNARDRRFYALVECC